MKEIHPDIVHVHSIEGISLLGAVCGFHPFAATAWGSDILVAPRKSLVSRLLVWFVLKKADLVTCDALHIQEPMIKLGLDSTKVRLIRFGVDTSYFSPTTKDVLLRMQLGNADSPIIMTSRRLDRDCDIDSLLTAASIILKEVPEARFVIVGVGSESLRLQKQSKSLGITERVIFTGWINHDQLPHYLNAADIYVSTALSDAGIAASTAEAMASGLPVIVTDFGDNRLWIQDNITGFLIPPRSPQILASRILRLIHEPGLRQDFGRRNRQIIVERNDWATEMGKMEDIYEELICQFSAKSNQAEQE